MYPGRPFFFDQPLERKVGGLAGELSREHEDHFGFARGPDQGCVDDAERLRDEGEPGAEEGDGVVWVLFGQEEQELVEVMGEELGFGEGWLWREERRT